MAAPVLERPVRELPEYADNILVYHMQLERLLARLKKAKYIVYDLETTDLSFLKAEICGIGIGIIDDDITELEYAAYIPTMYHLDQEKVVGTTGYLNRQFIVEAIKEYFLDFNKIIIAHNLKYDMDIFLNVGIDLRPKVCVPQWKAPETKEAMIKHLEELPKRASCADTQVMAWLVNEDRKRFGLKYVAKEDIGMDMTKLDKILGKKLRFHEASATLTLPYALMDIVATAKLFIKYYPMLLKQKLIEVLFCVEMPFVGVLQGIERRGMPVNPAVLEAIGERCLREMDILEKKIYELAGHEFSIGSGPQLAEVLHAEKRLPIIAKTDKGAVKVDADTLEELLKKGREAAEERELLPATMEGLELITLILKYRKLKKTESTYVAGILKKIDIDGRVHGSFHHTGTVTGRLSSSGPNLQNLPSGPIFQDFITIYEYNQRVDPLREKYKDDPNALEVAIQKEFMFTVVPVRYNEKDKAFEPCDEGAPEHTGYEIQWKIRDAFQELQRDWWLTVGDLGQMELRMTAHLAQEKTMIAGFENGDDIHYYNASIVTGKDIKDITKVERRDAKAVSFGLVYGKTTRGFAVDWHGKEPDFWDVRPTQKDPFGKINKVYMKKTQKVIDNFFNGFPGIEKEIAATHKFLSKYGFVKTITGRRRRIPEIFDLNNGVKNRAKRQSFNARVQGSSADYIKMAMIKMEREQYRLNTPGEEYQQGQIAQVHDEVLAVSTPENGPAMMELTKDIMDNVVKLSCPIISDFELGWKYGSCK